MSVGDRNDLSVNYSNVLETYVRHSGVNPRTGSRKYESESFTVRVQELRHEDARGGNEGSRESETGHSCIILHNNTTKNELFVCWGVCGCLRWESVEDKKELFFAWEARKPQQPCLDALDSCVGS